MDRDSGWALIMNHDPDDERFGADVVEIDVEMLKCDAIIVTRSCLIICENAFT